MSAILSFFPLMFTILGDFPKVIAAFQFIQKAILDAEATGNSGPDKLTAVLNDFETFLNVLNPAWGGTFDTIAKDIEAVVGESVALFNLFAHPKAP